MSREMQLLLLSVRIALQQLRGERHGAESTERGTEDGRADRPRPAAEEQALARIRQLMAGSPSTIDFEEVIRLARHHRVVPLVYRGMHDAVGRQKTDNGGRNPDGNGATSLLSSVVCPPSSGKALERLKRLFLSNAARNVRLTEELFRILDLFEQAGIKAVPIKGPALAIQAYGDLSMRQFDDLDFLLRLEDMMSAGDILKANGYEPRLELPPASMKKYLASGQDWPFRNEESGMSVDLDSVVISHVLPQPFTVEELLARLQPITIEGNAIQAPRPDDLLLILCLHGTHHAWERLAWLVDVAALLSPAMESDGPPSHLEADIAPTNLPHIRRKAHRVGLARASDLAFVLLDELGLGLPGTQPIHPHVARLTHTCRHALTRKQSTSTMWTFQVKTLERPRNKLRFIVRKLFVPSVVEWQAAGLPCWLQWLPALLRPFRLLLDLCRSSSG